MQAKSICQTSQLNGESNASLWQTVHIGCVLNVHVYTGRDTMENVGYEALPQPACVVLHLTDGYLNNAHHIITDRYYTSISLACTNTSLTGYKLHRTSNTNKVNLPDQFHVRCTLEDGKIVAFRSACSGLACCEKENARSDGFHRAVSCYCSCYISE